jgi:uroporphyrinogen decarboxylase
MTSRERVITALNRKQPDRVPAVLYGELVGYTPAIAAMLKERCDGLLPAEYFNYDITSFSLRPSDQLQDFSQYLAVQDNVTVDEWGVGRKQAGYHHYAEIIHPMQSLSPEEIRAYPFPDLDREYRYSEVPSEVARIHEKGLAAAYFAGSIFETAWYLRGLEQLFVDMISNAPVSDYLFDRITGIVAEAAKYLARSGLDLLILGDDIATQTGLMMSLEMWRQHLKPRMAAVIQAAKQENPDILIFYHSDGNVWDAIPDLIGVGVEVLNPVQPECMDPADVKREFGEHLSFFGTVGVQKTMSFGSPEEVSAEVRLRIETVGENGGLLLAPSHVLQPGTPWENIVAFFAAVEEFGRY